MVHCLPEHVAANTLLFTIIKELQEMSSKLAASSMGPTYFRDVSCLRF